MIYRRRKGGRQVPAGFYYIQSEGNAMQGFGDGEFIRLRDENGVLWQGTVDSDDSDSFHYRFRDERGNSISGYADEFGVLLQDGRGRTWRGYIC
jgi:hypothetical protein